MRRQLSHKVVQLLRAKRRETASNRRLNLHSRKRSRQLDQQAPQLSVLPADQSKLLAQPRDVSNARRRSRGRSGGSSGRGRGSDERFLRWRRHRLALPVRNPSDGSLRTLVRFVFAKQRCLAADAARCWLRLDRFRCQIRRSLWPLEEAGDGLSVLQVSQRPRTGLHLVGLAREALRVLAKHVRINRVTPHLHVADGELHALVLERLVLIRDRVQLRRSEHAHGPGAARSVGLLSCLLTTSVLIILHSAADSACVRN